MSDVKTAGKVVKLSEKQLEKLAMAQEAVVKKQMEYQESMQKRQDVLELVFDAHGAPKESQVNLQNGTLTFPSEKEATATAEPSAVSTEAPEAP
jgi:hypothetical protein